MYPASTCTTCQLEGFHKVINLSSRVATQWKHGSQKRRKTLSTATPAAIVISEAKNDDCATGGCPVINRKERRIDAEGEIVAGIHRTRKSKP